ncbi:MAG: dipeptidase [Propionibacteriaceae bacterium]|jgi:membrane dipeptidase|nr:dipeptidase [Propionibacteriaceae bacterium]
MSLVDDVLASTPVIDGHHDLAAALRHGQGYSVAGLDRLAPRFQTDLVRLRQGGVGAQFWSVWVTPKLPEPEAVVATLEQIDCVYRLIAAYPDDLRFARTADDIEAAWADGRIASLIGVEGGHSIARSLGVLRMLARLGARYMTLTHGDNLAWADSATDAPQLGGLNDEGRAVVAELNRLGMMVDLSHVSADTMRDALDVTRAPVIFSHSSARALGGHARDVPDDVLARVRDNGGVVQVTFVAGFLSAEREAWATAAEAAAGEAPGTWHWAAAPLPGESAEAAAARNAAAREGTPDPAAFLADYAKTHPRPPVTSATVADHVEHIRAVAGLAHVGLGGDYDGTFDLPDDMPDVTGYRKVLDHLADRGWSKPELEALTGRNVLRVMRAVEAAAAG